MLFVRLGASIALLFLLGSLPCCLGVCPDDPDSDLCDDVGEVENEKDVDAASTMKTNYLALALAVAMQRGGAQQLAWIPLVAPLVGMLPTATAEGKTCGTAKAAYKAAECCGEPDKELPSSVKDALCDACPYSFEKPLCVDAEPQAPRDLTGADGRAAAGEMIPKAAVLNHAQADMIPLVNVHFHLGAEHKSDEFSDDTDSVAFDGANANRRLAAGAVRPGFMCSNDNLTDAQMAPYEFQYCKGDVQVGKSYEVHYVHSTAGTHAADVAGDDEATADLMADGLGGAANGRGLLNPMVVVEGQVYHIVNDESLTSSSTESHILHGWSVETHDKAVMYAGSTTGGSHNNQVCSPYAITWHVDLKCHRVSASDFDKMCKEKAEKYGLYNDLYPHNSRVLVSPQFVVKSEYVLDYAE